MENNVIQYEIVLWRSFINGCDNSLELLYKQYFDHLYNYGIRYAHGNESIVEDTIQDLFIKLLNSRKNLSVPDSVKNYLFISFRNLLSDKLLSSKKNMQKHAVYLQEFDFMLHTKLEIIKNEEEKLLYKKVMKVMEQLTPRQREVIFLRFYENFSFAEIAEMLGLTTKGVYKLVARALENFRSCCDKATKIVATVLFLIGLI